MAENIKINLRADSGPLRSEFGKARKTVKSFGKDTSDSLRNVIKLGVGLLALRSGKEVFKDLVGSASDLSETLSKTAAIFGDDNSISAWAARQDEALGLSQTAALDYASRFGGALKEIGGKTATEAEKISQELVGLTSDLASFFNSSQDDARDAIAGALTGEFEMLKKYNVIINETILKDRARTMGLYDGKGALEAQTKQLVALDLIYRKTSDAQGDFAKTAEGVANQQRILAAQFENAQSVLGQKLIPLQMAFIKGATEGIEVLAGMEEELEAVANAMVALTNFLVENREVLGTTVKLYGAYVITLKAINFGVFLKGLAATAGSLVTSSAAITAQTAALNVNTAAKVKNSGAGGLSKTSGGAAAAMVGTAYAGFQLGNLIGDQLAKNEFNPAERIDATKEQIALSKKLIDQDRAAADEREQEQLALANSEFRRKSLSDASAAAVERESKAMAALAKQKSDLATEVLALSKDVFKVEIDFLAPEDQLGRLQDTVVSLLNAAETLARDAGLEAGAGLGPKGAFDLARKAFASGNLQTSKELLIIAQKLRATTESRADLEEQIAQARAEQADAAQETARNEEQQARGKRDLAIELKALQLEAQGRSGLADQLREEFDLRKEAERIARETGISEEKALALLRAKARLEEQILAAKRNGMESERQVVARGIFKMQANPRQDLRGIPDIGFSGGIRESVKRDRSNKRQLLEGRANGDANSSRFFERLIEVSESQLAIWNNLNSV